MTNVSDAAARLYDLVRLIRPAHRRLARSVAAHLESTGVGIGARAVLELLRNNDPAGLSVPDVARRLFLARQQIQLVMDGLERDGLVIRRSNPAHRRSPLFGLTPQGQDVFAAIHARELEVLGVIAGGLASEDVAAALTVLQALVDGFGAYEDDPDSPAGLA
jgi:DNA-binding MarR family transcriptional regulator